MKKTCKLVKIWQNYGYEFVASLFCPPPPVMSTCHPSWRRMHRSPRAQSPGPALVTAKVFLSTGNLDLSWAGPVRYYLPRTTFRLVQTFLRSSLMCPTHATCYTKSKCSYLRSACVRCGLKMNSLCSLAVCADKLRIAPKEACLQSK